MALSLDGTASGNGVTSSLVTTTLACSNAGNVICVAVLANGQNVTSITGGSVTFTQRAVIGSYIELWTGYASGTFNSALTVNIGGGGAFTTAHAFGVSGCPSSSYFDTNVSLPNEGTTDPRTVSTTAADTFIIGAFRMAGTQDPTQGSGFTKILGNNYLLTEYKIVSAQTSLSVTIGTGVGDSNGAIGDALVASSTAALTINVSDTATGTDTPTLRLPVLVLAVSDTATVTDTPTLSSIGGTGLIVVTDNLPLLSVQNFESVSDSTTVSDTPTLVLSTAGAINQLDTATVTDTPTVLLPVLVPTVSDTATLTDAPTPSLGSPAIRVTDTPTIAIVTGTSTSYAVGDTDTVSDTLTEIYQTSYYDSDVISMGESSTLVVAVLIVTSETVTLTETITFVPRPQVTDTVTVTDTPTLDVSSGPAGADTVTVNDTVVIILIQTEGAVNQLDLVSVSDLPTILLPILTLAISDGITVSDSPFFGPQTYITIDEQVTVSESAIVSTAVRFAVSDQWTMTDAPIMSMTVAPVPTLTPWVRVS